MNRAFLAAAIAIPMLSSCQGSRQASSEMSGGSEMEIKVTSTAFAEGGMIPSKYTCDGANVSPPLAWSNAPTATKTFALICDDPDAPAKVWVHWVAYDLPASVTSLPENVPPEGKLANGGVHGINDFGKIGYGGPCPPSGTHRYYFKVYALDAQLSLAPGATKVQLLEAMKGHIIAEGRLVGKYSRK